MKNRYLEQVLPTRLKDLVNGKFRKFRSIRSEVGKVAESKYRCGQRYFTCVCVLQTGTGNAVSCDKTREYQYPQR